MSYYIDCELIEGNIVLPIDFFDGFEEYMKFELFKLLQDKFEREIINLKELKILEELKEYKVVKNKYNLDITVFNSLEEFEKNKLDIDTLIYVIESQTGYYPLGEDYPVEILRKNNGFILEFNGEKSNHNWVGKILYDVCKKTNNNVVFREIRENKNIFHIEIIDGNLNTIKIN